MDPETVTVGEAEHAAHEAIAEVADAAISEELRMAATLSEHAQEEIDAAHELAEQVMRGAMETELGRQVVALNIRVTEWLDGQGQDLQFRLAAAETTLAELQATMAAVQTVTAMNLIAPEALPVSSPSTLPASEKVQDAIAETVEILPEALAPVESTQDAPPVKPAKRRLFL